MAMHVSCPSRCPQMGLLQPVFQVSACKRLALEGNPVCLLLPGSEQAAADYGLLDTNPTALMCHGSWAEIGNG